MLAVVAFIMAIVCAIPLVPLILGVLALRQIRERGERGRGLAIAAIVIHAATLLLFALALGLGSTGVLDDAPKRDASGRVTAPGSAGLEDIREGDCFHTDDDLTRYDDGNGTDATPSLRILPCDQPHKGEVYAVFELDDGPYPGEEQIVSLAGERCGETAITDYTGPETPTSWQLSSYYYFPSTGTWSTDHRQVVCFLGDPDGGTTTGSLRTPAP